MDTSKSSLSKPSPIEQGYILFGIFLRSRSCEGQHRTCHIQQVMGPSLGVLHMGLDSNLVENKYKRL